MHRSIRVSALWADESGASAVFTALGLSAVLGFLGLGLAASTGLLAKDQAQAAADAAAQAAARSIRSGLAPVPMARSVAEANLPGAEVVTQWPPAAGAHQGNVLAFAVEVRRPRMHPLGSFLGQEDGSVAARAVAAVLEDGPACALALADGQGTIRSDGHAELLLDGCIALSRDSGVPAVRLPAANPYPNLLPTPACLPGTRVIAGAVTYQLGTVPQPRCGGIRIVAGGSMTVEGISLSMAGPLVVEAGGRLETRGATLFVGNAALTFAGGARVLLDPPRSGPMAGIAILGAKEGEGPASRLVAGTGQRLTGALVLPTHRVELAGNSADCTQIIAREIVVAGTTRLAHACAGTGTRAMSDRQVALVE